jgi:hypothetical protein
MMFQITYENQVVCTDLEQQEANDLCKELNKEALAEDCEPLHVVEPQLVSVGGENGQT